MSCSANSTGSTARIPVCAPAGPDSLPTISALPVSRPRSLTITEEGARKALLNQARVERLTADLTDLQAVINRQAAIIDRLNQTVTSQARPPAPPPAPLPAPKGAAPAGPDPTRYRTARLENWVWRGLAAGLVYLALRPLISP
ncbi:hypothetical protein [Spirosoma sordidisoli]|uniref:hypothetical protein n=1 Tax=Spirosoma sordidisoli TaxID=2502893 RepID=UPI0013ECDFB5|nr:hypothetical protein [Spirosoma sordidisoli]